MTRYCQALSHGPVAMIQNIDGYTGCGNAVEFERNSDSTYNLSEDQISTQSTSAESILPLNQADTRIHPTFAVKMRCISKFRR